MSLLAIVNNGSLAQFAIKNKRELASAFSGNVKPNMFSRPYIYTCILRIPYLYKPIRVFMILKNIKTNDYEMVLGNKGKTSITILSSSQFKEGNSWKIAIKFCFNVNSFLNSRTSFQLEIYFLSKDGYTYSCFTSRKFKIFARRTSSNYKKTITDCSSRAKYSSSTIIKMKHPIPINVAKNKDLFIYQDKTTHHTPVMCDIQQPIIPQSVQMSKSKWSPRQNPRRMSKPQDQTQRQTQLQTTQGQTKHQQPIQTKPYYQLVIRNDRSSITQGPSVMPIDQKMDQLQCHELIM